MNNKLNEFLKITKKLNQKGITPLLMGSLGLEFVTQKNWDSRGWEAPDDERIDDWETVLQVMKEMDYNLIDLHEHEFSKNNISVEFGVIDTLPSFAGVSLDELEVNKLEGTKFLTPSIEAYLKIYIASSKDSYRADKNNHKDLEKVEYLIKQLRAQ
ncbi:phosphoribosylanthranilate isomerase [Vagococcus fluvialis]|uniref:phosphoribosylanthranilate isomerase n=1 Tax=Vagococcus fluvialis TaxID=2738 RepID=UPI003B58F9DA